MGLFLTFRGPIAAWLIFCGCRRVTFIRLVDAILLFLTNRHVKNLTSLHRLEIHSAKQTQTVGFTGRKGVVIRIPAAKCHSVASFRHFVPLVRQKSFILTEQICDVLRSNIRARLILLTVRVIYTTFRPWRTPLLLILNRSRPSLQYVGISSLEA